MICRRVETGTPDADKLGLPEDLFSGWLELTESRQLYLHFIISRYRNEGNTQDLIRRWIAEGYDVRVVQPRPIMQHILEKFRFVNGREDLPDHYPETVEVWYRPPDIGSAG